MVQIELPQDIDSNGRPHQAYPEPAEANDRSEVPNAGAPIPEPEEKPTIKRSFLGSDKKASKPLIAIVGAIGLIVLFSMFFHHPAAKSKQDEPKALAQPTANGPAPATNQSNLPTDQQAEQPQQINKEDTSADDIQHTRNADQTGQPLGSIEGFNQQQAGGNGQWAAPDYSSSAGGGGRVRNNNMASLRLAQVTKPSLTFVLNTPEAAEQAHLSSDSEEPLITNFGYQPGYHIATHLELVATTATKAPVIGVVDYDYRRNGIVIIPAGSRVIGEIEQASSTGIVGIHFNSIHLPNGEDISISAIGLDQRMSALKGTVTGRNRGKQFLLAALSGLGSTTAMFAGNNVSGSLSEADMMRAQAAQNMGQAADTQIQQLGASEHLIVTVPAGTQVQMMFTEPSKKKSGSQN